MLLCFLFFLLFTIIAPQGAAQSSYTWVLKRSGTSLGDPVDYERANLNNVYYGSVDRVYKSTDRGETFSQMGNTFSGATRVKNIIVNQSNPNIMLVALEGGQSTAFDDKIIKTTNAGQSWVIVKDGMKMSYFGLPMTPDQSIPNLVYTMSDHSFMKSTDFGDTWTTVSTPTNFDAPDDMEVFPNTPIILCGDNGVGIIRSTDYGVTWTQVFATSGEVPTIAIDPSNPGFAYATKWGGGGGFIKSSDYGITWTYINYFDGKYTWGVDVCPDDPNYVSTGEYSGNNYFSHDRGNTWFSTDIPSNNYSIHILDTMTIYSAQGNGFYKLTSPNYIPVELIYFNAQLNDNNVNLTWITASETNNLGFEVLRSINDEEFRSLGFVEGNVTTAEKQNYFYTDNITSELSNYPILNLSIKYKLKQVDLDGKVKYSNVVEVNQLPPSEFSLEQNFPNPFNPTTTISWQIAVKSFVDLKIYDLLGNEVVSLFENQLRDAGNYTQRFAAGDYDLTAGVYFYSLTATAADGSKEVFVQTRKMILLK